VKIKPTPIAIVALVIVLAAFGVVIVKAIEPAPATTAARDDHPATDVARSGADRTDVPWQAPRTDDPDNLRSF